MFANPEVGSPVVGVVFGVTGVNWCRVIPTAFAPTPGIPVALAATFDSSSKKEDQTTAEADLTIPTLR
jgi:hypothetical protein